MRLLGNIPQLTKRGAQFFGALFHCSCAACCALAASPCHDNPSDCTEALARPSDCSSCFSNCDIWSTAAISASRSTVNPAITSPTNQLRRHRPCRSADSRGRPFREVRPWYPALARARRRPRATAATRHRTPIRPDPSSPNQADSTAGHQGWTAPTVSPQPPSANPGNRHNLRFRYLQVSHNSSLAAKTVKSAPQRGMAWFRGSYLHDIIAPAHRGPLHHFGGT